MKKSSYIVPGIAALVAVALIAIVGPFTSPSTRAASALAFEAKFETPSEFYQGFDYGVSGVSQTVDPNGITSFHGDHNLACEGPTTVRDIDVRQNYDGAFWHCAPGSDPAKGHMMTGLTTFGYQHAWFAPKGYFANTTKVCWDINETFMGGRKWTEVQFVDPADATRYPVGLTMPNLAVTRGSGGFDLGYTDPGFRDNPGPSNGFFPRSGTLAGLKSEAGTFMWFQNENQVTASQVGWPGQNTNYGFTGGNDKATRFKHCLEQTSPGQLRMTQATPTGQKVMDFAGQIPQGPVRVVFHDSTYDAVKDPDYRLDTNTWHWDNIQVFTDDGTPSTTAPPTTAPPTTAPPTTAPPTTAPPTTAPPTTAPPTTAPPTTAPPTTAPPTTAPPTTAPPTTAPPTTAPPTTAPPTTAPPTTAPPTTAPPTTAPPTTAPPTTAPPTTAPPTTAPPTTAPPTTAPPTTAPPTTTPSEPAPPEIRILSAPWGRSTLREVLFTWLIRGSRWGRLQAADAGPVTCSLDGGPAEACESPLRLENLDLGQHELVITAVDDNGLTGTAVHTWSVVDDPAVAAEEEAAAAGQPSTAQQLAAVAATNETTSTSPPRAVLSFTGSHITEIALIGLAMIVIGLAFGSAAVAARRRSG